MKKNEKTDASIPKLSIVKIPLIITLTLLLSVFNVIHTHASGYSENIGSEELAQQQQQISGKVTDASTGELLPGVNVRIENTIIGALTNIDGNYNLQQPAQNTRVIYSFVGYITQEIMYSGQTVIDVKLEPDVTKLDEIIVTGYSVEKKKDIIGSVSVVNTDEMMKTNTATIGGQLQGRASGVFVSSDGSPNGVSKVRIRGFGSFGGSDPLYIIDGVPASSDAYNNLNPNDVESIQVLKDAASASVYGARAANGVLVISTKRGKVGRAKISIDSYTGLNYVSSKDFPDLLNAQEYGQYWWLANQGAGAIPTHPQYGTGASPVIPEYIRAGSQAGAALEGLRTSNPTLFESLTNPDNYSFQTSQIIKSADTDWFDEVFNPATIRSIQVGASGGSDVGTYSVSMNYFTQDNTSNKYAYYNRYTTRANSSFNITKNLKLGENLQVAYSDNSGSGGAGAAWTMQPLVPVYDIMGNPASNGASGLGQSRNPITENWRNRFDKTTNLNVFGNVYTELTIFKDLVARTSLGINYGNSDDWNTGMQTYEHAENTSASSLSRSMVMSSSWTWTNTLTYSKTLGNHALKILLASEAIRSYSDDVTGSRQSYDVIDNPDFVILNTGIGTQASSGGFSRESLSSLFTRVDYAFSNKYLINATVRRDGSSKFGINNRYGLFPSVAVGWRISDESFMEGLTWLSDLKLRASYGIIGNQNGLAAQNQYTRYNKRVQDGYALAGGNGVIAGFSVAAIGNPDARWEKSITTNIGFDATLFEGGFDASFEYYIKETADLLVQNQAPATGSWATQPSVNIGNMTNKGVDLTLTKRGNIIAGMSYEASANLSFYKNNVNEVLTSPDSFLSGASESGMGIITRTMAGFPISYIWGYQVDGFFETQQEVDDYIASYTTWITPKVGRWRIKDNNGDNKIDQLDRVQIGSPHPDFQVGVNLSLGYKNFDLSTFIFWNQGGQVFNQSRQNIDFNRFSYNRSTRMLYQSWTPDADNSNALLPKLDISDSQTVSQPTDYFVEDATYVRMKSLQLGYSLPSNLLRRVNLENLRIYVQGQNLLTFKGGNKPFTGLDPDAALSGQDLNMGYVGNQNPTPRQIVVGLNLGF